MGVGFTTTLFVLCCLFFARVGSRAVLPRACCRACMGLCNSCSLPCRTLRATAGGVHEALARGTKTSAPHIPESGQM
eukprot:6474324-Amphidinium_carterae.1